MKLRILERAFTAEEADAVAQWSYQPPLDIYDAADPATFLLPDYRPVYSGDDLMGFVCFGVEARVAGQVAEDGTLDVGAGLRPDLLGRGVGSSLMAAIVPYARQHFQPVRLRAAVAQFNTRSQRLARSAGFVPARTFVGPEDRQFMELVLELRTDVLEEYRCGVALYNAGDIDAYQLMFCSDAIVVRPDGTARGREEIAALWERELEAFPDRELTVLAALGDDEVVTAEWVWKGTHAESGRSVELRGMEIARFRGQLIAEYRMYWDHRQVQRQLR